MSDGCSSKAEENFFDQMLVRVGAGDLSPTEVIERIASAYLDGKPQAQGKRKLTRKERDRLFWSSRMVRDCPPEAWASDTMVLALARYFKQDAIAVDGLVSQVALAAPDALTRAVRYAEFVLNPSSSRRAELDRAAAGSAEMAELCRVLDVFNVAFRDRVAAVEMRKDSLKDLSAFDLLIYASLYAFEHLTPRGALVPETTALAPEPQVAWDAINDLLRWKLETAGDSSLKLNDDLVARAVVRHLRPLLFDVRTTSDAEAVRNIAAFNALMDAQIELNEFIARSAEAFCYDDSIRFEFKEDRLEIRETDLAARAAWRRDGQKLDRLHGYWFHRAFEEFATSDVARARIGKPENEDANRVAWIRALQGQLRLREVYGIAEEVKSDTGETVSVFQALLSLNLMSAFFLKDFLVEFAYHLSDSGDWVAALRRLAMNGLVKGIQNRMPLTWSDREVKVANITAWTANSAQPQGNPRMAAAILDFWSYDMPTVAERLQRNEPGLQPQLFERPVLRFGAMLVQLPWVVGMQNNSTAAINNLRRLGARRDQAREETQRIEVCLAQLLESRGFKVLLNWMPPRDEDDAGEVDLIASRDDHLFVLEVKSTFMRRSVRDAWLHQGTTLRKAGAQLRRKEQAVSRAIESEAAFRAALGLVEPPDPSRFHGWIVDTCIECDHQRFDGFLKISIEEMLIALRDEVHLLNTTEEVFATPDETGESVSALRSSKGTTLYPCGFTAGRFVEVIETEAVWQELDRPFDSAADVSQGSSPRARC